MSSFTIYSIDAKHDIHTTVTFTFAISITFAVLNTFFCALVVHTLLNLIHTKALTAPIFIQHEVTYPMLLKLLSDEQKLFLYSWHPYRLVVTSMHKLRVRTFTTIRAWVLPTICCWPFYSTFIVTMPDVWRGRASQNQSSLKHLFGSWTCLLQL